MGSANPCRFDALRQVPLIGHNRAVQCEVSSIIPSFMSPDTHMTIVAAAALFVAIMKTPWGRFRNPGFQHVFLGACVAALFLWRMRTGIVPVAPVHFLCLTTLTLMFGVPLAIIGAAILTAAMGVIGLEAWNSLPGSFLALGVTPVLVTWLALHASRRYLPPNPFVYIFVCAFFGAAVAMLVAVAANSVLLLGSAQISFSDLREGYLAILPLMMFPEAFINGLIVTGLVVFKPAWIASFDDDLYLKA